MIAPPCLRRKKSRDARSRRLPIGTSAHSRRRATTPGAARRFARSSSDRKRQMSPNTTAGVQPSVDDEDDDDDDDDDDADDDPEDDDSDTGHASNDWYRHTFCTCANTSGSGGGDASCRKRCAIVGGS